MSGVRNSQVVFTARHPQVNEQVEATNTTIKDNLKKKLEQLKGTWVDELPMVL